MQRGTFCYEGYHGGQLLSNIWGPDSRSTHKQGQLSCSESLHHRIGKKAYVHQINNRKSVPMKYFLPHYAMVGHSSICGALVRLTGQYPQCFTPCLDLLLHNRKDIQHTQKWLQIFQRFFWGTLTNLE